LLQMITRLESGQLPVRVAWVEPKAKPGAAVPATDAPGIALRAQPGLRELANFQGSPQPETIHDAQVTTVQQTAII